jgi:hypothetical protein
MVFGDPIEEIKNLEATKTATYCAPQPKKKTEKKKTCLVICIFVVTTVILSSMICAVKQCSAGAI